MSEECIRIDSKRWRIFRLAFFFLLAYDVYMLRYRSSVYALDFRISHAEWFYNQLPDSLIPGNRGIAYIYLSCSALSLVCMFGILYHGSAVLLTIMYGYAYFSNKVDSYQHHYLVFVLLYILSFVDTLKPRNGLTNLRIMVGTVYLYTAITKFHCSFTSGLILTRYLMIPFVHKSVTFVSVWTSIPESYIWVILSISTILLEVSLFFLWTIGWTGWMQFILGVSFHMAIHFSGFHILNFSFYMVTLYLLMIPDDAIDSLDELLNKSRIAREYLLY